MLGRLPAELAIMIIDQLDARELAQMSLTSRACQAYCEPLLYRLYGVPEKDALYPNFYNRSKAKVRFCHLHVHNPFLHKDRGWTVVQWAVQRARPRNAASRARAMAVLGKVGRYCKLVPGCLDRCYKKDTETRIVSIRCPGPKPQRSRPLELRPLHWAAWRGIDEIVEWLVQHGANTESTVRFHLNIGVTPLFMAVDKRHESTARLLLAHNAQPALASVPLDCDPLDRTKAKLDYTDDLSYDTPETSPIVCTARKNNQFDLANEILRHYDPAAVPPEEVEIIPTKPELWPWDYMYPI